MPKTQKTTMDATTPLFHAKQDGERVEVSVGNWPFASTATGAQKVALWPYILTFATVSLNSGVRAT